MVFDELIKKCEYEWDSDVEKEIQEQINHWVYCYPKLVSTIKNEDNSLSYLIPSDIKNDLWRDILTSICNIHNDDIIKRLKIKPIDEKLELKKI